MDRKFKFTNCKGIEGLYLVEPVLFSDSRGYNFEAYNEKEFKDAGLEMRFVQDNRSFSSKGVLRGLHFQREYQQGKLVSVLQGVVFDVAVDLRQNSNTYGEWYGIILSAEKKNMLYVPEGFAHGFLVLSDVAEFSYKLSDFYHPEDESGIPWNDKSVGIKWPIEDLGMDVITSERDLSHPTLADCKVSLKTKQNPYIL